MSYDVAKLNVTAEINADRIFVAFGEPFAHGEILFELTSLQARLLAQELQQMADLAEPRDGRA